MKIGNLYNLESFERFFDAKSHHFADALSGTILARQLTHVNATIFEKKYPELAFVNSGITTDNSGGYAQIIQSLRLIENGGFTTSGDAAGNKGKISLTSEDSSIKVIEREAESTWTDTEVKQADMQNINLPSRYVSAHNKIYLREVDESGLIGLNGNTGLLNHAGFTSGAAGGVIAALTAQEAYDEIAELITSQWNGVNNTIEYMATVVVMPVNVSNVLSSLILNTAAGDKSVMLALQANFGTVTFMSSARAIDTGAGVSATVAFSINQESMVMRVPETLTIGEIIKVGSFDHKVDSKYRIAGLDVLENTAGRILTGL